MRRVRFTNLNKKSFFKALFKDQRRAAVVPENKEHIPEPAAAPIRTRRIVFASGSRLFAAAKVKEIKIKFVLKK
jgi:hypothetical protein